MHVGMHACVQCMPAVLHASAAAKEASNRATNKVQKKDHLDAPVVDVADACLSLREQCGHRESHGGIGDVIAVVVNSQQVALGRTCTHQEMKLSIVHLEISRSLYSA